MNLLCGQIGKREIKWWKNYEKKTPQRTSTSNHNVPEPASQTAC